MSAKLMKLHDVMRTIARAQFMAELVRDLTLESTRDGKTRTFHISHVQGVEKLVFERESYETTAMSDDGQAYVVLPISAATWTAVYEEPKMGRSASTIRTFNAVSPEAALTALLAKVSASKLVADSLDVLEKRIAEATEVLRAAREIVDAVKREKA